MCLLEMTHVCISCVDLVSFNLFYRLFISCHDVFHNISQDAPAWTTFNQERHITAMVAADAADESNGCMFMVKGQQLLEVYLLFRRAP